MDELLERALRDKARLRRKLAALPVEDKLVLVARMQRRKNDIRRSTGRDPTPQFEPCAVGVSDEAGLIDRAQEILEVLDTDR